jgi:hypothetical protein
MLQLKQLFASEYTVGDKLLSDFLDAPTALGSHLRSVFAAQISVTQLIVSGHPY